MHVGMFSYVVALFAFSDLMYFRFSLTDNTVNSSIMDILITCQAKMFSLNTHKMRFIRSSFECAK